MAIRGAVSQFTWEAEGFALADRRSIAPTAGTQGSMLPGAGAVAGAITDATLLVKPEVAARPGVTAARSRPDTWPGSDSRARSRARAYSWSGAGLACSIPRGRPCRPERYGRDFTRISQEVLQHLASLDGVDLDITVESAPTGPRTTRTRSASSLRTREP